MVSVAGTLAVAELLVARGTSGSWAPGSAGGTRGFPGPPRNPLVGSSELIVLEHGSGLSSGVGPGQPCPVRNSSEIERIPADAQPHGDFRLICMGDAPMGGWETARCAIDELAGRPSMARA